LDAGEVRMVDRFLGEFSGMLGGLA
jgi:hypothetical protein